MQTEHWFFFVARLYSSASWLVTACLSFIVSPIGVSLRPCGRRRRSLSPRFECPFREAMHGSLDMRHVTHYTALVIKTFADRHTQELFATGRSSRLPPEITRRARRKVEYIDLASRIGDLRVPPGNRLHKLSGDRLAGGREGQYAVAINDQWRICFRFVDGDAFDVEITDYH